MCWRRRALTSCEMGLRYRVSLPGPFYHSGRAARSIGFLCGHMWPAAIRLSWRSGVVGRRVWTQHTAVRWASRPGGVDGVSIGALELRPSGAGQQPVRVKQDAPATHPKPTMKKEEDTMNMRHAAPRRTNAATRRHLKRSSEIVLAAIIYLTASCFAVVGTLGIAVAIWVLWGVLGVR